MGYIGVIPRPEATTRERVRVEKTLANRDEFEIFSIDSWVEGIISSSRKVEIPRILETSRNRPPSCL